MTQTIDRRKHYYLIIDTETANTFNDEKGLDRSSALVYDFGFAIIDRKGNIYEKYSFVTKEVFCDLADVMATAYYSKKLPQYFEDIEKGVRIIATLNEIRKKICDLALLYNIKAIVAHNARFDYGVCNSTQRYITKSKYRYFFPYGIEIWDTLKGAREVFLKDENYCNFCAENGFVTKHKTPRPQLTAEILYRYLTNNIDFIESHTALEDVDIERLIFAECMKKKVDMTLFTKD